MLNDKCPTCGMKKKRSSAANKHYWFLLNLIAEQLYVKGSGYTSQTWHVYFAQRYLGCVDITLPNGKVIVMPVSTASLSTDEFSNYVQKVEAWAVEHGVVIPEQESYI